MNLYFKVQTQAEELAARDELNQEILDQARRLGVELAPSPQTILLTPESEPPGAIPAPMGSLLHRRAADPGNGETVKLRFDP